MGNIQNVSFPIKGVNRTFARVAQPDGTAYDMLNVLPFDSQETRLRGGTRPGTVKLYADALDGPVKLMTQVATISAGEIVTPSFTDDFTYGVETWNDLTTVHGWDIFSGDTGSGRATFDITEDDYLIAHQPVSVASVGGNAYRSSPALVSGGTVQTLLRFRIPSGQASDGQGGNITAYCRMTDAADTYNSFVAGAISWTYRATAMETLGYFTFGGANGAGSATNSLPPSKLPLDTWHTIRLRVTGTTAALYLNNEVIVVFSAGTLSTSNPGYGFGLFPGYDLSNRVLRVELDLVEASTVETGGDPVRTNNLIVVSDGSLYVGDLNSTTQSVGGADALDPSVYPQTAFSTGKAYFVDGTNIVQLDVKTNTVETYTATAGEAPVGCRLACMYRDRLILAAPDTDRQNFFASRVGNQHDWDYGQGDPAAAFAGNASEAGRIGEDILSLMPASDDQMYIAGDHTIWLVNGDPADGGSIDQVSDNIGTLGANAWCKAPDGTIYMVGTGGFFQLVGSQQPVNISRDVWAQFFAGIDRSTSRITLAWDRDRHGCYIFIFPIGIASGDPAKCLWYDQRTQGFFPEEFPLRYGPRSTAIFDGSGPDDRKLLLGGSDGYIYSEESSATDDDGDDIDSFVAMGPYLIGDAKNDGMIEDLTMIFGAPLEGFGVDVTIRTGRTPEQVTSGTPSRTAATSYSDPVFYRPTIFRRRVRGVWASVRLGSNTGGVWAFESLTINSSLAGPTRGH